jgi:uncharacterized DUF497 family protein
MEFRWNDWNLNHIAEHGIGDLEAEFVINRAKPPFPEERADEKYLVMGRTFDGHYIQVIYLIDPDGTAYVIHARPLTESEKRRYRRRLR